MNCTIKAAKFKFSLNQLYDLDTRGHLMSKTKENMQSGCFVIKLKPVREFATFTEPELSQ